MCHSLTIVTLYRLIIRTYHLHEIANFRDRKSLRLSFLNTHSWVFQSIRDSRNIHLAILVVIKECIQINLIVDILNCITIECLDLIIDVDIVYLKNRHLCNRYLMIINSWDSTIDVINLSLSDGHLIIINNWIMITGIFVGLKYFIFNVL